MSWDSGPASSVLADCRCAHAPRARPGCSLVRELVRLSLRMLVRFSRPSQCYPGLPCYVFLRAAVRSWLVSHVGHVEASEPRTASWGERTVSASSPWHFPVLQGLESWGAPAHGVYSLAALGKSPGGGPWPRVGGGRACLAIAGEGQGHCGLGGLGGHGGVLPRSGGPSPAALRAALGLRAAVGGRVPAPPPSWPEPELPVLRQRLREPCGAGRRVPFASASDGGS